jgi:hypothetical protein
MQQEDFLGCLGAPIACIGVTRTAHLLGKDRKKDIPKSAVLIIEAVVDQDLWI